MSNQDAVVTTGQRLAPLVRLFRTNWRRVTFTYALYNVENLLHLAQPFVLGLAINGLLREEYWGLVLLVGQHLSNLLVSTARRMYDTRAFTAIYTDTVTCLVQRQRDAGVGVSTVAARSALSRELVAFFEHDLKAVFASVYGVIGALIMLVMYDWPLAVFCVFTVAPLVVLSGRLARRSLALNGLLNNQLEREVEVIEDGRAGPVRDHYRLLARWHVRLSDMEAWNFFQMEFFVLALMVAALARYCARPGVEAGDIYAVFAYVMMFVGGLDCVPGVTQQVARLHDIGGRVAHAWQAGGGEDGGGEQAREAWVDEAVGDRCERASKSPGGAWEALRERL
jgi:ABC-type multidrug transport system fused ATPase/permease subunit